jgi:hypothetical protein
VENEGDNGRLVVRLFAGLAERVPGGPDGSGAEPPVPHGPAPKGEAQHPRQGLARPPGLVLVNGLHAGRDAPLSPGDEIDLFPPLGGG